MRRFLAISLLLGLLAAACGGGEIVATTSSTTVTGGESAADQLAAARNLWSAGAPADYTVALSDSTGQSQIVAVRAGESITLGEGAEPTTVDEVFATIERSIGDGAVVDVEYHPDLGYPIRVVIDLDGDGTADIDLSFSDLEGMPIVQSLDELLVAKRLWDDQELDDYRYIFRADCTCDDGGTWDVAVRRGSEVTSQPLDQGAAASGLTMTSLDVAFDDLEQWFTDSAEFVDDGLIAVDVRMDPKLGYPRWFRVEGAGLDENFTERFTLIVTVDLVGPIDPEEPSGPTLNEADLRAFVVAFEQWDHLNLRDYSFVYTRHCECTAEFAGPVEVEVAGGEFNAATLLADGAPVAVTDVLATSIPEALRKISLYVNRGTPVDVTYHPALGYPVLAILDVDAVAVDGGLAFSISDVKPTADIGVVAGKVVAGPVCPVQTDPPTPGCEDQPVGDAPILMGEVGSEELIPVHVAADGTFSVQAPAGTYVITADPLQEFLGTPEPIEFTIEAGEILDLVVIYDTGIR